MSIVSLNRRSVGCCIVVLSTTTRLTSRGLQRVHLPQHYALNQSNVVRLAAMSSSRMLSIKTEPSNKNLGESGVTESSSSSSTADESLSVPPAPTLSQTTTAASTIVNICHDAARPMTVIERAKRFPVAVQQLYKEWVLCRSIRDASYTKMNAWTIDHPLRRKRVKNEVNGIANGADDNAAADTAAVDIMLLSLNASDASLLSSLTKDSTQPPPPGRIPRRQLEQQRRLQQDLSIVSPLVLVWLLPIVGYLPMFLSFMAPRQVLSRHFWNDYEVKLYRNLELQQRQLVYQRVAKLVLQKMTNHDDAAAAEATDAVATTTSSAAAGIALMEVSGQDAAGPLLNLMPLWDAFSDSSRKDAPQDSHAVVRHTEPRLRAPGALSSLDGLSREHLEQLALAIGIHQRLPPTFASLVVKCTMKSLLKRQIRRAAFSIVRDDAMLIHELHEVEQEDNGGGATLLNMLTDDEAGDACLLRGLPVDISINEMRVCLNNHIQMVQPIHARVMEQQEEAGDADNSKLAESLGLLTVHLPILRDTCRQQQEEATKR
ncbi:hypothetical protein MPSEU_000459500 [Mayamaea pseudoterrestris]|nr:hypothetical protein MPSEU_000459500 [Mayamaea pseudoterrestris]